MSKGFFISCAIDYPNANLHMGHVYEKTIADVLARVHRLNGEKVLFSVGVDEHGEKVAKSAKDAGMDPLSYVNEMSSRFQHLFDDFLISYDRFIRTSDPVHVRAAQTFFKSLYDHDDIYPDLYEGWYCVSDETFWTEKDLVEKAGHMHCPNPHCGKVVEKIKEESYFFKWSAYQSALAEWFSKNPHNVFPSFRKTEMENFMANGLKDVSFTRKSIAWGVPCPINEEHTIYVWSDALVNYLTVCGYPEKHYADFWPANVHVIGMDINRFHSLLWPAMLLSAQLPLPKQILVHGFVNDENGEKMSKSKGNVVDPLKLIPLYGVEPIRYYLLRESPLGNDVAFSEKNLIHRNNAELADGLGNWVYRVLSMLEKYCNSVIPPAPLLDSLVVSAQASAQDAYHAYLSHDPQGALIHVWKVIALGNKSIADAEPWKKMKEGQRAEVEQLLVTQVELIRRVAILLTPVLPQTAQKIQFQFGLPAQSFNALSHPVVLSSKKIQKGDVLFSKRELPA